MKDDYGFESFIPDEKDYGEDPTVEVLFFDLTRDPLDPGNITDTGRQTNQRILAEGVVGLKCTEARVATEEEWAQIKSLVPAAFAPGTVEVYANGAKNMFFRDKYSVGYGIVRVR